MEGFGARSKSGSRHKQEQPGENPEQQEKLRVVRAAFWEILHNLDGKDASLGEAIGDLFEAVAEEHLIQPTFIYDFPTEISPLSKCRADDPSLTERFELFIAGMEIANGFSELNDPADQERRFQAQVDKGGQEMPKEVDADYIRALSHGLPPTAGEGIGIDRLVMLLTDSHAIREVILFPLLRAERPNPMPTARRPQRRAAKPNDIRMAGGAAVFAFAEPASGAAARHATGGDRRGSGRDDARRGALDEHRIPAGDARPACWASPRTSI